jgi:hypothetical protein
VAIPTIVHVWMNELLTESYEIGFVEAWWWITPIVKSSDWHLTTDCR